MHVQPIVDYHPRFGTRLFNAGKAEDRVSVMRVGEYKALGVGFGQPAETGDLVILSNNGDSPEPFEVERTPKSISDMEGFPRIWVTHLESLLRYAKKEN